MLSSFERAERCCLAERSEAVILGWANGTCYSSEAPEGESYVGVTLWLARGSNVLEPGCSGR